MAMVRNSDAWVLGRSLSSDCIQEKNLSQAEPSSFSTSFQSFATWVSMLSISSVSGSQTVFFVVVVPKIENDHAVFKSLWHKPRMDELSSPRISVV